VREGRVLPVRTHLVEVRNRLSLQDIELQRIRRFNAAYEQQLQSGNPAGFGFVTSLESDLQRGQIGCGPGCLCAVSRELVAAIESQITKGPTVGESTE
jgi:hypothetical protein